MNEQEALVLCRLAKSLFPSMPMDEYTPQAWALALDRERFEDAKEALRQLSREQQWLHCSDIVGRVKRIRRDRVLDYGTLPEPPADAADPEAYSRWYSETIRAIGDGRLTPDATPQIEGPRRDIAALGHVGQEVAALHGDADENRAKAQRLDTTRTPMPTYVRAAAEAAGIRRKP